GPERCRRIGGTHRALECALEDDPRVRMQGPHCADTRRRARSRRARRKLTRIIRARWNGPLRRPSPRRGPLELAASARALLEHGDGRETLALEELEKGAAAGGDIRDPVG